MRTATFKHALSYLFACTQTEKKQKTNKTNFNPKTGPNIPLVNVQWSKQISYKNKKKDRDREIRRDNNEIWSL